MPNVTIADKTGSEQLAGWIAPVKHRFGEQIDIRGIADVSPVPRLLRSLVREKFRELQTYPVMMDWTGDAVKAFTYVPDHANVLVLDGRGQILLRASGPATERAVQDLCAAIDAAVANRDKTNSTFWNFHHNVLARSVSACAANSVKCCDAVGRSRLKRRQRN